MKKKEPQGDTDELAEGLSALSLTQKENNEVQVNKLKPGPRLNV